MTLEAADLWHCRDEDWTFLHFGFIMCYTL